MNIRPFQIGLFALFGLAAVGSLIFVSVYQGSIGKVENPYGDRVVIWGTLDRSVFNKSISQVQRTDSNFHIVEYIQKDPRTFDEEFVNAIAEGRSPDLIVLPHHSLVKHRTKLQPFSYETIPERGFRDTYVEGAEIFLRSDGVYGVPFAVDPIVMYWNRDMFSNSGLALPPKTWEELTTRVLPRINRINSSLDVEQSTIAFGEYDNITYAKDLLAMLLLQSGSTIVDEMQGTYTITLSRNEQNSVLPADSALSFYTQFSSPTSRNYSWNRALRNDRLLFLAGDLALHFAPGSEYAKIVRENPNLNFDVEAVPQGAGATIYRDYGTLYAYALPRAAANKTGAYRVALQLADPTVNSTLTHELYLAPAHRALIARGDPDPYRQTVFDMALISHGWLDPDPLKTGPVFETMIEDVSSGRSTILSAVSDATERMRLIFKRY